MSGTLSENSPSLGGPQEPAVSDAAIRTLHVQAVFRDVDEEHVQALAAEMIARAHELANQPECQCDVDVDVRYAAPQAQR